MSVQRTQRLEAGVVLRRVVAGLLAFEACFIAFKALDLFLTSSEAWELTTAVVGLFFAPLTLALCAACYVCLRGAPAIVSWPLLGIVALVCLGLSVGFMTSTYKDYSGTVLILGSVLAGTFLVTAIGCLLVLAMPLRQGDP